MYSYWNSRTEEWEAYRDIRARAAGTYDYVLPAYYTFCKEGGGRRKWSLINGSWQLSDKGPIPMTQGWLFSG